MTLREALVAEYLDAKEAVLASKRRSGQLSTRERAGMLIHVSDGDAHVAFHAAVQTGGGLGALWPDVISLLDRAASGSPDGAP